MKHWLLVLCVAILLCACQDTSPPTPTATPEPKQTTLTVPEYAAWCANRRERPELLDDVQTYGELKQLISTEIATLESVQPPDALYDYHRAEVAMMELVRSMAAEQPDDKRFSEWDLLGPGLMAAGIQEAAENDLPDNLRTTLEAVGCITTDDTDE